MQFSLHTKMADIIHHNYLLLPVLNRFNIQPGFGDQTIEEICFEKGINTEFFLVIINSFHDPDYFPQEKLLTFSLSLIVDYIKRSHDYYLQEKIPRIENLINKMYDEAGVGYLEKIGLVQRFFAEYKKELIEHIEDEENNILPHVLLLEKKEKEDRKRLKKSVEENLIDQYAEKHSDVEEKLYDLKNIIIKYLPASGSPSTINDLLFEIFRLERDLNDHARIEDKVLIPKVRIIEQEILAD